MPRPTDVAFIAGRVALAGELLLPDVPPGRGGRHPWVVLVGSWLPRTRDGAFDRLQHPAWFAPGPMVPPPGVLARLAERLAAHGVASFRYDMRGAGRSEGSWEAADLFTRIDDARDALGAMRGRPELDLARTGIVGHGEGAIVALSVAIADPGISALTLVGAPARSGRDLLRRAAAARDREAASGSDRRHPIVAAIDRAAEEVIERADRHEPELRLRLAPSAGERPDPASTSVLALAGWEQAFATSGRALATMLHRSVEVVHGEHDAWCHPDEANLLVDALRTGGNDPALVTLPGAGHDLAEAPDGALDAVAASLAARIEARPLPPVLLAMEEMGE